MTSPANGLSLPISLRPQDVRHLTLSTFHGCPPEQIELITKHLITEHDLNVIVKLNPTLLGYERVGSILHETLGYHELELDPAAFDADLQFNRGVELIGRAARVRKGTRQRIRHQADQHHDRQQSQGIPG
ncbi:MAG: hypothetical protein R2706_13545 [Acidimicrobiales bacterium]